MLRIGADERRDPSHYAFSLIQQILGHSDQKNRHAHFRAALLSRGGQSVEQFRANLDAVHAAARRLGLDVKSLGGPRNQWRPDYLTACAETGFGASRGDGRWSPEPWAS